MANLVKNRNDLKRIELKQKKAKEKHIVDNMTKQNIKNLDSLKDLNINKKKIETKKSKDFVKEHMKSYKESHPKLSKNSIKSFLTENQKENIPKMMEALKLNGGIGVGNIVTSNSTEILTSNDRVKPKVVKTKPKNMVKTYTSMKETFFDYLDSFEVNSGKEQKGNDLIEKVLIYDEKLKYSPSKTKNITSVDNIKKAHNKFKKSKEFIAFDLEIMGGTNEHGYKTFYGISEFSVNTYEKIVNKAKIIPEKSYTNIIGLDNEDLIKKYESIIQRAANHKELSIEEKVISEALGKLGHKDTIIENTKAGVHEIKKYATSNVDGLITEKTMRKGLNKYIEIGKEQNKNKAKNGLRVWENQFINALDMLQNSDKPVVGWNSIKADMPWINQMIPKLSNKAQEVLKKKIGEDLFVQITPERHTDLRAIGNLYGEKYGKAELHRLEGGLKNLGGKRTPMQQETQAMTYLGEMLKNTSAHNARLDADVVANLSTGKFYENASKAVDEIPKKRITIKQNGKQLFIPNHFAGSSELSFRKNDLTKSFHLSNNTIITKDGIEETILSEFGMKTDVPHTLEFAGEVSTTDKFVKEMTGIHDSLAQKKIFIAQFKPYVSESNNHSGANSVYTQVYNNKEEFEAYMSSGIIAAEKDKNGIMKIIDKKTDDLLKSRYGKLVQDKNGNITDIEYNGLETVLEFSDNKFKKDPAERMIRDLNYKRTADFEKLHDLVQQEMPEKKNLTAEDIRNTVQKIISKHQSENSTEDVKATYEDLKQAIGYYDYENKEQKLITNTIDNMMTSLDILISPEQRKVSKEIRDYIDTVPGLSSEQKNSKFKDIFDGLKSKVTGELEEKTELEINNIINGKEKAVHVKEYKDHFDIDLKEIFKIKEKHRIVNNKVIENEHENILRINLAQNKEYSAVDDLLKTIRGESNLVKSQKDYYGLELLDKVIENFSSKEQYKEAFKDFEYKIDGKHIHGSVNSLMEDFIGVLRTIKEDDISAGILKPLNKYDITNEYPIMDLISKQPSLKEVIYDIGENTIKSTELNGMYKNKKYLKSKVQQMVSGTLMPDKDKFIEDISKRGLDNFQLNQQIRLYEQAEVDLSRKLVPLVESILTNGADIVFDTEHKNISAATKSGVIQELDIMKVDNKDGLLYLQVGRTNVALNLGMGGPFYKPTVETNIAKGFEKTYNPKKTLRSLKPESEEILEETKRYISEVSKNIKEGSSITTFNKREQLSSQLFDYSKVMEFLHPMNEAGMLNNIDWRDQEEAINSLLTVSDLNFEKSSSTQKAIIQKNLQQVLGVLGENNEELKEIFANLSFATNEKDLSVQKGYIGNIHPNAGDGYMNDFRPVTHQRSRGELFRIDDLSEKILKNNLSDSMEINQRFLTKTEHATKDILNDGMNSKTASVVAMNIAKISDVSYKALIIEEKEKVLKDGPLSIADEKAFNKLLSLGTHEDSMILRAGAANVFENVTKQNINSKKQLAVNISDNLAVIKNIKELANVMPTIDIAKDGTIVFKLSEQGRYVDRRDPLLSVVGFGDDVKVDIGSKINKGYLSFNVTHKKGNIKATNEEITESLNAFVNNKKLNDVNYEINTEDLYSHMKEKFNSSMQVESILKEDHVKISISTGEKAQAGTTYMGLGDIDNDIKDFLVRSGNENLIGKTLTDKHIENLVLKDFEKYNIGPKKFKDEGELLQRIAVEQNYADDILGRAVGEDISVIANPSEKGHKNFFTGVENTVNNIIKREIKDNRLDEEEATKKVFDKLQSGDRKVFNIEGIYQEGKNIIMPNGEIGGIDNIDTDRLHEIAKNDYNIGFKTRDQYIIAEPKKSKSGNIVGIVTRQEVGVMEDDKLSSSSATSTIKEELKNLENDLLNVTDNKEKLNIEEQIRNKKIELNIERNSSTKLKITDREMGILTYQKADNDLIKNFERAIDKGYFEEDEAKKILKDFIVEDSESNSKMALKEEVKRTPIMKDYTDSVKNKILYKEGEQTLTDALEKSPKKYDHLKSITNLEKNGRKVSIRAAEEMYSITKGEEAMIWNSQYDRNGLRIKDMAEKGFELTNIADVVVPLGNDASYTIDSGNSFFSKNMLIDLGHDIVNENERIIAVPAFSRRSEEQLIKYDFQNKLIALSQSKLDIDLAKEGKADFSVEDAIKKYQNLASVAIETINSDVTKKKGIIAEAVAVELDQTAYGKATNFVNYIGKNNMDKIGDSEASSLLREQINKNGEEFVNFSGLKDAMFDGKSLLEHQKEGKSISATFLGEGMFEELGFFKDNYRKEFNEALGLEGLASRDDIKQHLKTEGVAGIATRHPVIKEGSMIFSNAYYSESLGEKEIKIMSYMGERAGGDSDGDRIAFTVLKGKEGKDSILQKQSDTMLNEYKVAVYDDAIGVNKYFENTVLNTIEKDTVKTFEGGDLKLLTKGESIAGKIYANFNIAPGHEGLKAHSENYKELQGLVQKSANLENASDIDNTHISDFLKSVVDPVKREAYENTAIFEHKFNQFEQSQMARIGKDGVGNANIPLLNLRKLGNIAYETNPNYSNYNNALIQEFSNIIEQEVISSKKGNFQFEVTKSDDFRSSLKNLISSDNTNIGKAKDDFKSWMNNHIGEDELEKGLGNLKAGSFEELIHPDGNTKNALDLLDDLTDAIAGFNPVAANEATKAGRVGIATNGIKGKTPLITKGQYNTSFMAEMMEEAGLSNKTSKQDSIWKQNTKISTKGIETVDGREWLKNGDTTGQKVKNILSSTEELFSKTIDKIGSKNLAIGALGVAGAVMLAGYTSGNPSQPKQRPIEDEFNDDFYDMPMLQDQDLAIGASGQQGYVVNVNANSNTSNKNIEQAINNAVSNSVPTDINISMNVNNNTGNITQKYIQDLISGAL